MRHLQYTPVFRTELSGLEYLKRLGWEQKSRSPQIPLEKGDYELHSGSPFYSGSDSYSGSPLLRGLGGSGLDRHNIRLLNHFLTP